MASGSETCDFALEGVYAALHRLGLPFSLSGELQSRKLTLQQSVWTVKLTQSGISVSMYWSCLNKNKKKRKKKKNASHQLELDPEPTDTEPAKPDLNQAQSSGAVDLISCPSVQYEEKDGISGVTYTTKSGIKDWTPVRQVRRGRTRRTSRSHSPQSGDSDSDTESLMDIPPSSNVHYSVRDGQPGLFLATPRIRMWTPIAARTRLKTKQAS